MSGRTRNRKGRGRIMTPIVLFIPGDPRGQPRALSRAIPAGNGKWRAQVYEPEHTKTDHQDSAQRSWAHANLWKLAIKDAMVRVIRDITYKAAIKLPLDTPMRVDIEVVAPRPAAHYGTGKNADTLKAWAPYFWDTTPDRDNLDKIILDTITALGFWTGDERVCDGRIIKRYQRDRREATGAHVRISDAVPGAHTRDDQVEATPELFTGATT